MAEKTITVRVIEKVEHVMDIIVDDDDLVDGEYIIDPDDDRITDQVGDDTVANVTDREVICPEPT